jgi:hypothetical protein
MDLSVSSRLSQHPLFVDLSPSKVELISGYGDGNVKRSR